MTNLPKHQRVDCGCGDLCWAEPWKSCQVSGGGEDEVHLDTPLMESGAFPLKWIWENGVPRWKLDVDYKSSDQKQDSNMGGIFIVYNCGLTR